MNTPQDEAPGPAPQCAGQQWAALSCPVAGDHGPHAIQVLAAHNSTQQRVYKRACHSSGARLPTVAGYNRAPLPVRPFRQRPGYSRRAWPCVRSQLRRHRIALNTPFTTVVGAPPPRRLSTGPPVIHPYIQPWPRGVQYNTLTRPSGLVAAPEAYSWIYVSRVVGYYILRVNADEL